VKRLVLLAVVCACSVRSGTFTALGDDGGGGSNDGGGTTDGATTDGAMFVAPAPFSPGLAASGPDQIQSVHAGPAGSWYVAGYIALSPTGAKNVFVMKVLPTGGVDSGFGVNGTRILGNETTAISDEIDLAVQSDGKIVVSYPIPDPSDTTDRNIAITRIDATGNIDTTFGTANGTMTINPSVKSASMITDAPRALAVDTSNNIYVLAIARAMGTPDNSDFLVAKVVANGAGLAGTWGVSGVRSIDILESGSPTNATPRDLVVLANGSVIAGGYSVIGGATRPVYFKLDPTGVPDAVFGTNGIINDPVLAVSSETYGMVANTAGTKILTAGYGRESGVTNLWFATQLDAATGARAMPWGGAGNGAKVIDVSPSGMTSNNRGCALLPGDRLLMYGSTGPGTTPEMDAAFTVLDPSGEVDPHYTIQRFKFTPAEDRNDSFWSAAASGNKVLVGGWRGANGPTQTEQMNDDAYWIVFDLP
jgi:uncharacterized delta-60 repeat protein